MLLHFKNPIILDLKKTLIMDKYHFSIENP